MWEPREKPTDETENVTGRGGFVGCCREARGQEEKRDSHYHSGLHCLCFPPVTSTGCAYRFAFFEQVAAHSLVAPEERGSAAVASRRPPSLCARIPGPLLPGEGKRIRSIMLVFSRRYDRIITIVHYDDRMV